MPVRDLPEPARRQSSGRAIPRTGYCVRPGGARIFAAELERNLIPKEKGAAGAVDLATPLKSTRAGAPGRARTCNPQIRSLEEGVLRSGVLRSDPLAFLLFA